MVNFAERLYGHNDVVDVAVATSTAGVAVVAWRAAEREDSIRVFWRSCFREQDPDTFEREIGGRDHRSVCLGADAGAHVEGVKSGAGKNVLWWSWMLVSTAHSG